MSTYRTNFPRINGEEWAKKIWGGTLTFLEVVRVIITALIVIVGVLAINFADVAMGAVSGAILFGGTERSLYGIPALQISTAISMGSSALQIILWMYMQKQGFSITKMWNSKIEGIRFFMIVTAVLWVIDTGFDIAPVLLFVGNSEFQQLPEVYPWLVFGMLALVFVLCGFAEPLTANLRSLVSFDSRSARRDSVYPSARPEAKPYDPYGNRPAPKPLSQSRPISASQRKSGYQVGVRDKAEKDPTYHPASRMDLRDL